MKATGTLGSPFLAVSKFWSCVTLSSIGTAPSQAAEANLMNTNERGEGLRERMQEERFRAIALLTRTVGRTAPCLLAELLTLLPLPPSLRFVDHLGLGVQRRCQECGRRVCTLIAST